MKAIDAADIAEQLHDLHQLVEAQAKQIEDFGHQIGLLEDKNAIERLQYLYGFFIDNRMWDELTDLFADDAAWIEIGERGRYIGKENIKRFLHEVLGGGRWGLVEGEVINHVQQQLHIVVDDGRTKAWARARAEVQGNSPPDSPTFLFADGVYENDYIKEEGKWKILGVRVTMTFYATLEREAIWFTTAPPSDEVPPDQASHPIVEGLGRQFNEFRVPHPVTGKALPVPVADPSRRHIRGGGGVVTGGGAVTERDQ